jgi:hypothetical protein
LILGYLKIGEYLERVGGKVKGSVITDAKSRHYLRDYCYQSNGDELIVQRDDSYGDAVRVRSNIELDDSLVAFFGLYSGDGAKGKEDPNNPGRIIPSISFSQKEKHLVRFAVDQFRRLFPGNIRFTFSLGEDSAYFMAGEGKERLESYYREHTGNGTPPPQFLNHVRPRLNDADRRYISETRPDINESSENCLAFYYQHREAMQSILSAEKADDLASVGILAAADSKVTASLRRPFKKGARKPGGSSRSDEIHLGGLNGIGELFLKMMHEIEDSVLLDTQTSSQGLVCWNDQPSRVGVPIDLYDFFSSNPFAHINGERPVRLESHGHSEIIGQWRRSSEVRLRRSLRIDPLWCYVAGLYLAEGTTAKEKLFRMFSSMPGAMGLGFTSSEGASLELMLRTLRKMFFPEDCLAGWKVKVGSQYFPELVVTGLKHGVPMLRGGNSGDGKLRTMEISLAFKQWALDVADSPLPNPSLLASDYSEFYSHVEPTGAGVARIDFWASSSLCRWYFPVLMYTVFRDIVDDPLMDFY